MTMTFGGALEALKLGHRVAREGWNGKGMWLALVPELTLPDEEVVGLRRYFPEGDIRCGAYIVMHTAQAVWQPGWLASQADMLAEDWFVLPEDAP